MFGQRHFDDGSSVLRDFLGKDCDPQRDACCKGPDMLGTSGLELVGEGLEGLRVTRCADPETGGAAEGASFFQGGRGVVDLGALLVGYEALPAFFFPATQADHPGLIVFNGLDLGIETEVAGVLVGPDPPVVIAPPDHVDTQSAGLFCVPVDAAGSLTKRSMNVHLYGKRIEIMRVRFSCARSRKQGA